jgi:hypothetical protein
MKTRLLLTTLLLAAVLPLSAQVPQIINYQGKIAVGSTPFTGTGQFRFALVDGTGATSYWSNDATSTSGSQPTNAVSLPVVNGLYIVPLGDATLANMTAIPATVFANDDVRVRVWFNDGSTGSQLLSPDQRITSVGYAMVAGTVPDGAITTAKLGNSLLPQLQSSTTAPFAASAVNVGTVYFNSADKRLFVSDGSTWRSTGNSQAVYRWAVWSLQEASGAWIFDGNSILTGGIPAHYWDSAGVGWPGNAWNISSNKQTQAALFNKSAAIAPNSLVWADTYAGPPKMIGVLFRVRNITAASVAWTIQFRATAGGGVTASPGTRASVSLNGASNWNSSMSNPYLTSNLGPHSVPLSIPPSRISTVICIAGCTQGISFNSVPLRTSALAFQGDSLTLPAGLEFVDDLGTATGGYEQ